MYLIRHGQASFGEDDYDRLSERGELQARVLGGALVHLSPRIGTVASGDMLRHRQTAQACLQAMGRPAEWQADAGWNEFDHVRLLVALLLALLALLPLLPLRVSSLGVGVLWRRIAALLACLAVAIVLAGHVLLRAPAGVPALGGQSSSRGVTPGAAPG